MEQKHISAMKNLHDTKNEEFVSDIVSYIKANNITDEDFFLGGKIKTLLKKKQNHFLKTWK